MLLVALVRRPHGLLGEVSVEVATEFPQRFRPGLRLTWRRGSEARKLEVESVRPHGDRLLLGFCGVGDAAGARALAGGELSVAQEEAFPPPPGFHYSHEIEGFVCEDRKHRRLGIARGLAGTAAGPMLTVETAAGKEALVPFVEEMVLQVNREEKRIILDLPEGLLEL